MLQAYPELVWSFWWGVGMVLTIPIAFFWFNRWVKKQDFRETIEDEIIPLRIMMGPLILVAVPFIVGETLAMIVCLFTYPDEHESILYRGFRYYLVVFGALFLILSLFYLSNRRKMKINDDSNQIEKEE